MHLTQMRAPEHRHGCTPSMAFRCGWPTPTPSRRATPCHPRRRLQPPIAASTPATSATGCCSAAARPAAVPHTCPSPASHSAARPIRRRRLRTWICWFLVTAPLVCLATRPVSLAPRGRTARGAGPTSALPANELCVWPAADFAMRQPIAARRGLAWPFQPTLMLPATTKSCPTLGQVILPGSRGRSTEFPDRPCRARAPCAAASWGGPPGPPCRWWLQRRSTSF